MLYEPSLKAMVCQYCGQVETAVSSEAHAQHTFDQGVSLAAYARNPLVNLSRLSTTMMAVDCQGCGADLMFEPPDVIQKCPFCARQIVALPRPADPALPPMALVPFSVTEQQARQCLQRLQPPPGAYAMGHNSTLYTKEIFLSKRPFQALHDAELTAVYLPFWIYDGSVHLEMDSEITVPDEGTATAVKTTSIHTQSEKSLHRQRVCAIKATRLAPLAEALLETVISDRLCPYHPRYLHGVKVYRYELGAVEGFQKVRPAIQLLAYKDLCERVTKVRSDALVDEASFSVEIDDTQMRFWHVLLPVWLVRSPAQEAQEPLFIDGQSGALLNKKIPPIYDTKKFLLWVAISIALIVAILGCFVVAVLSANFGYVGESKFFAIVGVFFFIVGLIPIILVRAILGDLCRRDAKAVLDIFWNRPGLARLLKPFWQR